MSARVKKLAAGAGFFRGQNDVLPVSQPTVSKHYSRQRSNCAVFNELDMQRHLAMSVDDTAAGLAVLAACTADVRQWYLQNGLQLNPDKSEALVVGTAIQLYV